MAPEIPLNLTLPKPTEALLGKEEHNFLNVLINTYIFRFIKWNCGFTRTLWTKYFGHSPWKNTKLCLKIRFKSQ